MLLFKLYDKSTGIKYCQYCDIDNPDRCYVHIRCQFTLIISASTIIHIHIGATVVKDTNLSSANLG